VAIVAFADPAYSLWLLSLIGAAAVLYSSLGHGGARRIPPVQLQKFSASSWPSQT
jgi:hypothetical protein